MSHLPHVSYLPRPGLQLGSQPANYKAFVFFNLLSSRTFPTFFPSYDIAHPFPDNSQFSSIPVFPLPMSSILKQFTKYLIHWQFYRNLCILAYPLHNYFDSFWLNMNINVQLSPSLIMRKLPIRKFQLLETPGRRKEKRSLWVWWFGFFNVLFCTVLKGHMKFKCKYFGHISIMYSVCHLNRM